VTDAQRTLRTPCSEWNVRDLVAHQIRGMRMYTVLLTGGTRDAAVAASQSDVPDSNWVETFHTDYRTMFDAFSSPGALERTLTTRSTRRATASCWASASHPSRQRHPTTESPRHRLSRGTSRRPAHGWAATRPRSRHEPGPGLWTWSDISCVVKVGF
jgi:hypothetical protein